MNTDEILNTLGKRAREVGFAHPAVGALREAVAGKSPLCCLDGYWALEKALNAGAELKSVFFCASLLFSEQARTLFERCVRSGAEIFSISQKTFEKLSDRDDPCGILAVASAPAYTPDDLAEARVLAVLDGLETPGNIGTILRSCDGAGIDGVVLVNNKVRLNHPKLIKGSMGACFAVPMVGFPSVSDCRAWLSAHGFEVWLADTRATMDYRENDYRFPAALVCGSERFGISREWYDGTERLLKIPMRGVSDSLNVGVAASIILYEMAARIK